MRLIDADALMEVIRQHEYPLATRLGSIDNGMFTIGIQQAVDEAPAVDPESLRPKGRWEHHYDNYNTLTCSECGNIYQEILFSERAKYCPNCGAKMEDNNGHA